MKKLLFGITLLTFSLINPTPLKASNMDGGQIYWVCLEGSGKYVFFMQIFRECSDDAFPFTDQYLKVSGGSVDSILLKPDWATFNRYDGGKVSPKNLFGCQKKCDSSISNGAKQFLQFVSEPISLSGVPPSSGLVFSWSNSYRNTNQVNLDVDSSTAYVLRAVMYPYKNNSLDTCYDSSPTFMDLHAPLVSIASAYNINHMAYDYNMDSIGISFDSILTDQNFSNPTYAEWNNGFSTASPFPGPIQDSRNRTVSLDSLSGHISGRIFSTATIGKDYAYSIRLDAYREGIKIASVWRDALFATKAPDTLNTGQINEMPKIKINGVLTNNYHITAYVGDTINIPIELLDSNTYFKDPNDTNTIKQYISLRPEGFLFSSDFNDPNDCRVKGVDPCALMKPNPVRNTRTGEMEFVAQDSLKSNLSWILTCKAISYYEKSKLHTFNFLYMDDYCDPELSFASLSIDVKMRVPEIIRNVNVLSVKNLSGIKWYLNDSLIYRDSTSIKIIGPGVYSVSAWNYCYKGYYTVFPVGLDEYHENEKVNIYPNPFKEGFVVEHSATELKEVQFNLMNILGEELQIRTKRLNGTEVQIESLGNLAAGVYFLQMKMKGENRVYKVLKL